MIITVFENNLHPHHRVMGHEEDSALDGEDDCDGDSDGDSDSERNARCTIATVSQTPTFDGSSCGDGFVGETEGEVEYVEEVEDEEGYEEEEEAEMVEEEIEIEFEHSYHEVEVTDSDGDADDLFDSIRLSLEAHKRELDSGNSVGLSFSICSFSRSSVNISEAEPSDSLDARRVSNISAYSEYTYVEDEGVGVGVGEEPSRKNVDIVGGPSNKIIRVAVDSDDDNDEYEEQVIEKWFGRDENPDDLEAACRKLIMLVYKDDPDVDSERMLRRSPLPELYKYLKQHYEYKVYSDKDETVEEPVVTQKSIGDIFKLRIGGPQATAITARDGDKNRLPSSLSDKQGTSPAIQPSKAKSQAVPDDKSISFDTNIATKLITPGQRVLQLILEEPSTITADNSVARADSRHEDDNSENNTGNSNSNSPSARDGDNVTNLSIGVARPYLYNTVGETVGERHAAEVQNALYSCTDEDEEASLEKNDDSIFRRASAIVLSELAAVSSSFASYYSDEDECDEWEFDEQVVERWVDRDDVPDNYEAACRSLIATVYPSADDVDADRMMRRTLLPELYSYLKQECWYRMHQSRAAKTSKVGLDNNKGSEEQLPAQAQQHHLRQNTSDIVEEIVEIEDEEELEEEEVLDEIQKDQKRGVDASNKDDEITILPVDYEEVEVEVLDDDDEDDDGVGDEDYFENIRRSFFESAPSQSSDKTDEYETEEEVVFDEEEIFDDIRGRIYYNSTDSEEDIEEVVESECEIEEDCELLFCGRRKSL